MKKALFTVFFLTGMLFHSRSQEADTVITIKNSDFTRQLLKERDYIYPIFCGANAFLPMTTSRFSERGQVIIKTASALYVQLAASGFLFKLNNITDSTLSFKRIDKTDNINYNFGAYFFSVGEDLYNLGGYGHWKSNGLLRRYNFISNDWGAEPINEEVQPQYAPLNNAWYDNKKNQVYVPFQRIVNGGMKERSMVRGALVNGAKVLDLKTGIWSNQGLATKKCTEILSTGNFKINCARGLIVVWNEELYLLDFHKNEIFKLEDNITAQSVLRLGTSSSYIFYHKGNKVHHYNLFTGETDSTALDLDKFSSTGEQIHKANPLNSILSLVGLALMASVILWVRTKKKKKRARGETLTQESSYQISFTDVEKNLLQMLIEKSVKKERAVISEINYVLGVKDKNTGLQKKVRSDTFNSINEKYRFMTQQSEPLIQSVRSEVDKRYFEYFIDQHEARELSKLLSSGA